MLSSVRDTIRDLYTFDLRRSLVQILCSTDTRKVLYYERVPVCQSDSVLDLGIDRIWSPRLFQGGTGLTGHRPHPFGPPLKYGD